MNLRHAISDALVQRGYSRKERTHLLQVDNECSWVVDTGPLNSKRTDIAPFVGIRVNALEDLTSTLLEVPSDDSNASVGANVGYVLGVGYKTYIPPTAPDRVMADIDDAVMRLQPYANLPKLPEVWKLTGVYDPGWRYRDIAIKLLTGHHGEILRSLAEARKEFCEYEDEVCDQFLAFERNVRSRL
jgi:hypothetical protein